MLAHLQDGDLEGRASRLQCGPHDAADIPPWTISKLLGRYQHCQLAAVDLPHFRASASDGAGTSTAMTCVPPQLVYLRLADVPQQWAFGTQLLVLIVSGHSASSYDLPDSIAVCSGLRHLSLSDWVLRSLPDSIGSLVRLEVLLLGGCSSMAQLPESVTCLHLLQRLDLAHCAALQQLPDLLGNLTSLEALDLSSCHSLQQLPASVGALRSLRMLDASSCMALRQLPDSMGSLCSLEMPDVSSCQALQQLPDSIGSLSSLKTLSVSGCVALQRLPDSIGCLSRLEVLDISWCQQLQHLPDAIGHLSSLKTLDISWCQLLQQLPDSISSMPGLTLLKVSSGMDDQQSSEGTGKPGAAASTPTGAAEVGPAEVNDAFVIYPTEESEAEVKQLRDQLLADGYLCTLDDPDMLVFVYVGVVGECSGAIFRSAHCFMACQLAVS